MSFPNYENVPGQPGGQQEFGGAGPGGPPQQQQDPSQMGGQMMDQSVAQYQGGNGQPGSAGGQSQEGDQKTTLWYVQLFSTVHFR